MNEVFADRTYQDDGSLTPRSKPDALIETTSKLKEHILQLIRTGTITSTNGIQFPVEVDTICIHGDKPHALRFAKVLYEIIRNEGVSLTSLSV